MWTVLILNLHVDLGVDFVFVCLFLGLQFMCFYVSLDQYISVLLAFVVLGFSSEAKRLAGKNVGEMTYSVMSGMQNLNSVNLISQSAII